MDIYDIYVDDLLDQARAAVKPQWFHTYGVEDAGYVDVETHASTVKEFSGLKLPGLLHTEGYIRALFERGRRRRTEQEIANDVQVRLIRKRRLTDSANSLELVAVVDEASLRREVGEQGVMREQLRHLIEMAALPSVTLQALPLGEGAHSSMDGGFTLSFLPRSH